MKEDSQEGDEPGGIVASLRTSIARCSRKHVSLQKFIRSEPNLSAILKILVCSVMFADIVLMTYALLAVTYRATSLGLSLIDSLPLAFYALPLLVFLPSMLKAYYNSRSGIVPLVIFTIAGVIFILIAPIQSVFYLMSALNMIAIVVVFMDGRLRPQGSVRSLGKRTVGYIVLLNLIGLVFPASVYIMGQTPIATGSLDQMPEVYMTVPTASIEYTSESILPSGDLLQALQDTGFGVDIQYLIGNNDSLQQATAWLVEVSNATIPLRVSLHSNRTSYLVDSSSLGDQNIHSQVYSNLRQGAQTVLELISTLGIENSSIQLLADLRMSESEWATFFDPIRSLNLGEFSHLVEHAISGINQSALEVYFLGLKEVVSGAGLSFGLLVDSFVIDDFSDNDATLMLTDGVTPSILRDVDFLEIDIMRSKFSLEMDGDVGEYLVHSYSRSARALTESGIECGCRLGLVGAVLDIQERANPVYQTVEAIARDVVICSGNVATSVAIASLESLMRNEGVDSVANLRDAILDVGEQSVTYTFRIYAFRAVVFAIDSFRIT